MNKVCRVFIVAIVVVCSAVHNVFAFNYQSHGDLNAGRINIFKTAFENESDWIAAENTPLSEEMYKFRLTGEAPSEAKEKIRIEDGDLIIPITSSEPCYDVPIDLSELRSLFQTNGDGPVWLRMAVNAWYEPADENTYNAADHYRLFDLQAYGSYRCRSCGAEREDYLFGDGYGKLYRCPWRSFAVPAGEQPLYKQDSNGKTVINYISEEYRGLKISDRKNCPAEGCGGKMYLTGSWLRLQPSAADYEGTEKDDYDENGLLSSEKVGKIHIQYFEISRGITAYSWDTNESTVHRQAIVHSAKTEQNSEGGYTFSAKVLNMKYDGAGTEQYSGASFHPTMIIAGYKDGRLADVLIKEPENNSDLWVFSSASKVIFADTHPGVEIDGFEGDTISVSMPGGDYDTVKGFMWESLGSMKPYAMSSMTVK